LQWVVTKSSVPSAFKSLIWDSGGLLAVAA
jgi:hypothetical protein